MNILEVVEPQVGRLEVMVESIVTEPVCPGCGERAWVKDRPVVELVDLTCFAGPPGGRPSRSANAVEQCLTSRRPSPARLLGRLNRPDPDQLSVTGADGRM